MRMRYSNPPDTRLRLTSDPRRRRRQGGNIMIMFTMMLPFVLIPLVGLAIDATMLYTVNAKLQTAVDGASLAAAESLSAGLSTSAQQAAATLAADQFIRANMTAGGNGRFWGAFNLNDENCTVAGGLATPSGTGTQITYTNLGNCIYVTQDNTNKLRSVSLVASVQVPLLFMRLLGLSTGTVASSATASRRDVVMVLVIDRSGSMVAELPPLQSGAEYFVDQFSSGRDKLGLVLIGGSSLVAYPPTDWGKNPPTGATGPDVHFKDETVTPSVIDSLAAMKSGSNTGTAEGLMLAWKELQAVNEPGALNIIVLWTDGAPNGITADFNAGALGSATNSLKNSGPTHYTNQSGCTNTNDGTNGQYPNAVAANSLLGWIAQGGGYVATGVNAKLTNGVRERMQTSTAGETVSAWVSNSGTEPLLTTAGASGCNWTDGSTVVNTINIPSVDYYGNATQGVNAAVPGTSGDSYTQSDYKQGNIWTASGNCNAGAGGTGGVPLQLTGTLTGGLAPSGNACQIGLASWNAADMAGRQIHGDTTLTPIIYTMGYAGSVSGSGGVDPVLLSRLSNVNGTAINPTTNMVYNTVYNSTIPSGLYIQIQTVDDVTPAFQILLSQILRLSM